MSTWLILIFASVITSCLSAIIGMGGGILLLGVLVMFLSPKDVVPVHGVIQLISNSTRWIVYWPHIQWPIVARFSLTVFPGALVGIWLFQKLDPLSLQVAMGTFILLATYWPKSKGVPTENYSIFFIAGALTGFLGIIVGATGPFLAPFFVRKDILKEQLVATKAFCQSCVHLVKIPLFGMVGFNYSEQSNLILILSISVILGTLLGKQLLGKISERVFKLLIKTALTLVGVKILLWDIWL